VWQVAALVIEIPSIVWILHRISVSAAAAQKQIAAHLLAITNSGIDPTTTPVYEKHKMYGVMVWICGMSFVSYLFMNVMQLVFGATN
jgi:hypothetical protein